MNISILKTADNSNTLFVEELNETYHSKNGALDESLYVFIEKGLFEKASTKKHISILEVGFGTGLNAILTLMEADKAKLTVAYHTLETNPLPLNLIEQLEYAELIGNPDFMRLHEAEWDKPVTIEPYFILQKQLVSLLEFTPSLSFDLIYFDAFAPDKQPELWTPEVFNKLFACLNNEGILVTYSSKGDVKRNMKSSGFKVERLPGPPPKRHMLRARKLINQL